MSKSYQNRATFAAKAPNIYQNADSGIPHQSILPRLCDAGGGSLLVGVEVDISYGLDHNYNAQIYLKTVYQLTFFF
jgi:hypothetical protein